MFGASGNCFYETLKLIIEAIKFELLDDKVDHSKNYFFGFGNFILRCTTEITYYPYQYCIFTNSKVKS